MAQWRRSPSLFLLFFFSHSASRADPVGRTVTHQTGYGVGGNPQWPRLSGRASRNENESMPTTNEPTRQTQTNDNAGKQNTANETPIVGWTPGRRRRRPIGATGAPFGTWVISSLLCRLHRADRSNHATDINSVLRSSTHQNESANCFGSPPPPPPPDNNRTAVGIRVNPIIRVVKPE